MYVTHLALLEHALSIHRSEPDYNSSQLLIGNTLMIGRPMAGGCLMKVKCHRILRDPCQVAI